MVYLRKWRKFCSKIEILNQVRYRISRVSLNRVLPVIIEPGGKILLPDIIKSRLFITHRCTLLTLYQVKWLGSEKNLFC